MPIKQKWIKIIGLLLIIIGVSNAQIIAETTEAAENPNNNYDLMIDPEILSHVKISNRYGNKFQCDQNIQHVTTTKGKGLKYDAQGKNLFISLIKIEGFGGSKPKYVTNAIDLYVTCGDKVFILLMHPENRKMMHVRLRLPAVKKVYQQIKKYRKETFAEIASKLAQDVYQDQNLSDNYSVQTIDDAYKPFKKVEIKRVRKISIEGTGISLIEYIVKPKKEYKIVKLKNKDFLSTKISEKIAAVALYPIVVETGKHVRLFIIEKENMRYEGIL